MKVLWLGMDDTLGCTWHWHELRLYLRDHYDVDLAGPGYSWEYGIGQVLASSIGMDDYDVVVLDDCNAMGYVPIAWDIRPKAKLAWREHDWHNKQRQQIAAALKPDKILGCYKRRAVREWSDPFGSDPNWSYVPHAVNTERFNPGPDPRKYKYGMYGMVANCYPGRAAARQELRGRKDSWLPVHGGYWMDGRGSNKQTYYNDKLADALRDVTALWVSPGQGGGMLLKYFEGAASGCLLVGVRPEGFILPELGFVDLGDELLCL